MHSLKQDLHSCTFHSVILPHLDAGETQTKSTFDDLKSWSITMHPRISISFPQHFHADPAYESHHPKPSIDSFGSSVLEALNGDCSTFTYAQIHYRLIHWFS
jgi:hypothetical protein